MSNPCRSSLTSCLAILLIVSTAHSQPLNTSPEQNFTGVVREKQWSKSIESYCHGGSNYFVLENDDQVLTLGSKRTDRNESTITDYSPYKNKQVKIRGDLVSKLLGQKQHCPDPLMQCPQQPINCLYINVKEIENVSSQVE